MVDPRGKRLPTNVIEQAVKMANTIGIKPTARQLGISVSSVRRYVRAGKKKK